MKFNSILSGLKNYETGKPIELVVREFGIAAEDVIKLASNENPFGSSPQVLEVLKNSANLVHLYPDDSYFELKNALASHFGLGQKNILIGAGSDQVIQMLSRAKLSENSAILCAGVTFAMYEIYAAQLGAKVLKTRSAMHDLDELLQIYKQNQDTIQVIFLCLPNNPLGECLDADEVYKFISQIDPNVLVVVDGAYQEFAKFKSQNKQIEPKILLSKFKNAIYLGTFSKAYGLGGMRVGYGLADESVISELGKLRAPFNITTLSLKAATAALADEKFVSECVASNFAQMSRYEALANELGVEFIESFTNFITFKFKKHKSDEVALGLLKRGIIVRDLKGYGINAVRITIGTAAQNDRVLANLKEILK